MEIVDCSLGAKLELDVEVRLELDSCPYLGRLRLTGVTPSNGSNRFCSPQYNERLICTGTDRGIL